MFDISHWRPLALGGHASAQGVPSAGRWPFQAARIGIGAISLYFAVTFGIDACQVLASPYYGLQDHGWSELLRGVSRLAGLQPDLVPCLAGSLGAAEIVVAVLFTAELVQRCRARWGADADHAAFEVGAALVVALAVIGFLPAIAHGASAGLPSLNFSLALVAIALERWDAGLAARCRGRVRRSFVAPLQLKELKS